MTGSPAVKLLTGAVLLIVFTIMLAPVVLVVWSAFFDSTFLSFPPPGYTPLWFLEAAKHDAFLNGFVTSFKVALAASALGVVIATLASIGLVRHRFPGRGAINALLLSPLVVPNIVLGIALYMFFIWLADYVGLDLTRGLTGLVLAHTLLTLPWAVRLISANLIGIDRSIEEAALNLGASPLRSFLRVTLPMMRSGMIAATLFCFIISFENLEISLLLVGPGTTTLPIALLQYLEFKMDPTIAAASTVQIAVIALLLLVADRFVKLGRIV